MANAFALFLALLAPLAAQPDRHGLPACSGQDRELAVKHGFIVCHSGSQKTPVWTVHELSTSRMASPVSRRLHFRRDDTLSWPGASNADYRNTSFSTGHLVPARDVAGDEQALCDSFLLSNAVPQNDSMNRSSWRRLENQLRKLSELADSVIVVTGAIFTEVPERIGASGVAVPSELYKVILVREQDRTSLVAAIVPNSETASGSLKQFLVTVTEVEKRTGLKFFPGLDAKAQ